MGRLRVALVALLLIPLADALFLVFVATRLGWQLTVALVVLTALLGMLFVRAEGRHTLREIQRKVATGEQPTDELVDGGLLIAAGAFLLTPGLVTDAVGFLLVVPPTRYVVRRVLKDYAIVPYLEERSGGFVSGNVYTFGFPNDGASGSASGPFGPGGFGPEGSDGASGDDGSTVDLGGDEYDVDDEDR
jgi:UPF0716 protein FxsA